MQGRPDHWKYAAAALAGGLVAAIAAVALAQIPWSAVPLGRLVSLASSVEALEGVIASWGPAGPLASIGLMVLHSFVPFPAEMLAIANGMLFGLLLGFLVTWTGAMLGAVLAFGLARLVGQGLVFRLLGETRRATVELWTRQTGVRALLVARLIPVISFNLVNYAAGLAGVRWWTFLWTTAIGIVPVTVVSVLVGSHMVDASWELWTLAALALVLVLVLHWRRRRSSHDWSGR